MSCLKRTRCCPDQPRRHRPRRAAALARSSCSRNRDKCANRVSRSHRPDCCERRVRECRDDKAWLHAHVNRLRYRASREEFFAFNRDWMLLAIRHLLDGGLLATFINWRSVEIELGDEQRKWLGITGDPQGARVRRIETHVADQFSGYPFAAQIIPAVHEAGLRRPSKTPKSTSLGTVLNAQTNRSPRYGARSRRPPSC